MKINEKNVFKLNLNEKHHIFTNQGFEILWIYVWDITTIETELRELDLLLPNLIEYVYEFICIVLL